MNSFKPSPRPAHRGAIDRSRMNRVVLSNGRRAFAREPSSPDLRYVGLTQFRQAVPIAPLKSPVDQFVGVIFLAGCPSKMARIDADAITAVVSSFVLRRRRRTVDHFTQKAVRMDILAFVPDDPIARVMDNERPRQACFILEGPRLFEKLHRNTVRRLHRTAAKRISVLPHSLVVGSTEAATEMRVIAPFDGARRANTIPCRYIGHDVAMALQSIRVHHAKPASMARLATIGDGTYWTVSHLDTLIRVGLVRTDAGASNTASVRSTWHKSNEFSRI